MRHLRVEARSCTVRKDWIRGGSRGEMQQRSVYSTYRSDNRPTSQDRHLHVACVPLQSLAAARVYDRVKIEEGRREERMRDCDKEMWTNGHPFYTPPGTPSSHRSQADSLVGSAVDGQSHAGIHVL